jgi:general secretion pathway protein L
LNLGLAALAIILFVMVMDESLANRASAVEAMRAEVDKAQAEAKQVAALKKTLADSISGANFLTERKRKGPLMVALMDDLSRRLPDDTYLERLQIENKQVQLQGQAREAAKLIALLGASPCLGNPGFQGQVQPDPRTGKERFQINADLKECSPIPEAKAAAPVPAQKGAPPAAVASAKDTPKADPAGNAPEAVKTEAKKPAPDAPRSDAPKPALDTSAAKERATQKTAPHPPLSDAKPLQQPDAEAKHGGK